MGESKRRTERLATVKDFAIEKRELFQLTPFLVNREKDRDERRRCAAALEELRTTDLADQLISGVSEDETRAWQSRDTVVVSLTGETIHLLLLALDTKLGGVQGLILGRLEQRLISLRDGTYRLPAEIRVTVGGGLSLDSAAAE